MEHSLSARPLITIQAVGGGGVCSGRLAIFKVKRAELKVPPLVSDVYFFIAS